MTVPPGTADGRRRIPVTFSSPGVPDTQAVLTVLVAAPGSWAVAVNNRTASRPRPTSTASAGLDRNLEPARRIGDPRRTALACRHAAKPAEPDGALRLLADARAGFRSLSRPEPHNLAKVALWQGGELAEQGDHADAIAHLGQALALMTELKRGLRPRADPRSARRRAHR